MKSIKKRDIIEFVVAEMKLSPVDDGFDKACENYVKLQLRIGKKAELNNKLKCFCGNVRTFYKKSRKYLSEYHCLEIGRNLNMDNIGRGRIIKVEILEPHILPK